MKALPFVVMVFALTSCGPAFVPSQTKKNATASDVTGLWEYNDIYHKSKLRIRFLPGGTFEQTVPSTPPTIQRGTWSLTGATITVNDILLDVGAGKPSTNKVEWYLIDDPHGSSELRIFGGDIDNLNHWEDFKLIGR